MPFRYKLRLDPEHFGGVQKTATLPTFLLQACTVSTDTQMHAHVKTKHNTLSCLLLDSIQRRVSTGVRILIIPLFILMVRRCHFLFALVD